MDSRLSFLSLLGSPLYFLSGDILSHLGIGCNIFHLIVIHDTQISLLEGFCHSLWHFGLGFDDLRLHFLGIGAHFLLLGDGHGTAFFGSCLCDLLICFCLIGLELGADISAYIDIGDIDGEDLKSCPRVETFAEDRTGM